MIQIRRIRTFTPAGHPQKSADKPMEPPIEVASVSELFLKLDLALAHISPEERYNVYYTLGNSTGDSNRKWLGGQDAIPFDVDGIVDESGKFDEKSYLDAIFEVLGVDRTKCIVVASGNGLQILVQPPGQINDQDFFNKFRGAYKRLCDEIAAELTKRGLKFTDVDTSSFAPNRLFRLPGTENRKDGKTTRVARLIAKNLEPQPFHITEDALPTVAKKKKEKSAAKDTPEKKETPAAKVHIDPKHLNFFSIDTPAVEKGCDFLRWARKNPNELSEPQWYGLLSIVGRLEDGRQKSHQYSSGHKDYSEKGTDRKLDQAMAASGPRTCENISELWDGCGSCPHYKKVNSPVSIKSADFVATEKGGFYLVGKSGQLSPQFEDLRRFFNKEHAYRTNSKSAWVYVWDGRKFGTWSETELRNYAHEKFNPKPAERIAAEFRQWITRTNLITTEWFDTSTRGFINFDNGVFEIATGKLLPHSPDKGFLYCLPFGYDPLATCPVFDQFMVNITCGDRSLAELMLEFSGYTICDPDYWLQKALLLIGEGSNGKSTFLKIMEKLLGRQNVSFLSLYDLQIETSRSHLEGKLLNISDELPNYNFKNTELLKKLLGGTMTIRKLYHDGLMIENRTKFIFAGNAIPSTDDVSEGLFRRLVIVPFNAKFSLEPSLDAKAADVAMGEKMEGELPGIFNLVFNHYKNLKARGYLIESASAKAEHSRYREEVDRTGSWIKENLYWNGSWDDAAPYTEINTIFERYVTDFKRSEEKPLPKFHWTKHARRQIDHFEERYKRRRIEGIRHHILRGVEFKKDVRKEDF